MRIGVASEIESSSTGSSETPSCAATPAGWLCSGNVAMRSLQVLYGILQVLYDVLQRDHTYRGTTPARSRMVACRSTRCTVWLYHLARSCVVITRILQVLHAVLQALHAVLQVLDAVLQVFSHLPPYGRSFRPTLSGVRFAGSPLPTLCSENAMHFTGVMRRFTGVIRRFCRCYTPFDSVITLTHILQPARSQ